MLVIMAGCSKQTERQPWQADNSDAWKYDESLPVPVQFASQGISITTKGIIEDDSGLEGKSFGIFGLSVQHQEDGTVSPAWNPVNTSQPAQLSQKLEVSSIIIVSLLSLEYWAMHSDDCFMLLMQVMALAFCLAEFNAGRSSAARMAIIAMTTSNSISEKYLFISTSPYSFL